MCDPALIGLFGRSFILFTGVMVYEIDAVITAINENGHYHDLHTRPLSSFRIPGWVL